jgi:methionyl aminopeptidase
MESYEVEINGKMYPVKPVRSLCAHDIKRYLIHGGKSIPFINNNDQTKMEEGEIFAIETFGSTSRGRTYEDVSDALLFTVNSITLVNLYHAGWCLWIRTST